MSKNARKECSMDKAPMIAELHKRWFCSRVPVSRNNPSAIVLGLSLPAFCGHIDYTVS